jgi:hypothetical protein
MIEEKEKEARNGTDQRGIVWDEVTDPALIAKLRARNPRHSQERTELEEMSVGETKPITAKTESHLKALIQRMYTDHQKRATLRHWTLLLAKETGSDGNAVRRDS